MTPLETVIAAEAERPVPEAVAAFARSLAGAPDVLAVLFYGSALRSGDIDSVLDFYVLTSGVTRRGARGWVERRLWPEIRFETLAHGAATLHAKVAVLPAAVFARAAQGRSLDTTIWTRFAQPSRLAFARDVAVRDRVLASLGAAAVTASDFAAVLGPARGEARNFWAALFRSTYAAELRVEPRGREATVVEAAPAYFTQLLPLAWAQAGRPFSTDGHDLSPRLPAATVRRVKRAWRLRSAWGKPLNAARLVKAAFTAPGVARYAAGKLARHTALDVEVTPWSERHPVLAGLALLWRMFRRRGCRRQADAR